MSGPVFVLPVGSSISFGTGIITYSGLVTSIGRWLARDDLGPVIPDFIQLVEERANRMVRAPEMEETAPLSAPVAVEAVALPSDFLEARSLYLTSDPKQPLEQCSPHQLRHLWASSITGKPLNYAIVGGEIRLGPAPDGPYDLVLDYYQRIPPLSAVQESNWLIAKHPSYYLYGSLLQAELYGWNDERLPMIKAAWDEVIDELTYQSTRKRYGAGPLRMQSGVAGRQ